MMKKMAAVALMGALSLATVPAFTNAALAQGAAAPEPPQGAQPMDNGGGSGSMSNGSMEKGSSMKKKSMKHSKKHMHHSKKSM